MFAFDDFKCSEIIFKECGFTAEMKCGENGIDFKTYGDKSDCLNIEDAIYIDSQSVFDFENSDTSVSDDFLSKTSECDESNLQVYNELYRKSEEIIKGYIYFDDENKRYLFKKDGKDYQMKNTSFGVKQIGLIQLLLAENRLGKNSFLIIDEPKSKLHPEW